MKKNRYNISIWFKSKTRNEYGLNVKVTRQRIRRSRRKKCIQIWCLDVLIPSGPHPAIFSDIVKFLISINQVWHERYLAFYLASIKSDTSTVTLCGHSKSSHFVRHSISGIMRIPTDMCSKPTISEFQHGILHGLRYIQFVPGHIARLYATSTY